MPNLPFPLVKLWIAQLCRSNVSNNRTASEPATLNVVPASGYRCHAYSLARWPLLLQSLVVLPIFLGSRHRFFMQQAQWMS